METFIADLPRTEAPTDAEVFAALRELVRVAEPFLSVKTAAGTIYHPVIEQAHIVLQRG